MFTSGGRGVTQTPALLTGATVLGSGPWGRFLQTAMTFDLLPDRSALFGFPAPLLHSVLAPILVLAVGALLLNLDSLAGWVLLGWLLTVVALAGLLTPTAPDWPALLTVLPAVALAIAFGMDRLRVVVMESLGTWTVLATVYLAVGLVVIAGTLNWIQFYHFANLHVSPPSVIGRALRELPTGAAATLLTDQPEIRRSVTDPVVDYLTDGRHARTAVEVVAPEAWSPAQGPSDSEQVVLILADEAQFVPLVTRTAVGEHVQTRRDINGNPLVYAFFPALRNADASR